MQIVELYRTAPFADLLTQADKSTNDFQARVTHILGRVPQGSTPSPQESDSGVSDTLLGNRDNGDGTTSDRATLSSNKKDEQPIILNPFQELCPSDISSNRPPLFAIELQNLFVY